MQAFISIVCFSSLNINFEIKHSHALPNYVMCVSAAFFCQRMMLSHLEKTASFCLFKSKTIGGITGNGGWGHSRDELPALGAIFYAVMQLLEKNWPK